MVKLRDDAPAVSEVRNAQATRLARLRHVLELSGPEAADLAGLSAHAWYRMERGEANIDAVRLARFCQALRIPAEYVVTGSFAGLSDQLIRNLAEKEARDRAVASGHMPALPDRPRRGRPRRRRTGHNESEDAPMGAEPPRAPAVQAEAERPPALRKVS